MHVLYIIPNDFSCIGYSRIEPIQEIRPLKLVFYESVLENLCKSSLKLLKDLDKTKSSTFSNTKFIWNREKYSLESFDALITDIQKHLEEFQMIFKFIEKETPDKFAYSCDEESFEFISSIYCVVDQTEIKKFEGLFKSETFKKIKEKENQSLYVVYCLKSEREKTKEWLRRNNISFYAPKKTKNAGQKKVKLESKQEIPLGELIKQVEELVIVVYVARGLAEALNKYSLSCEYKYKIVSNEMESNEYKAIKEDNKIQNFEDSITKVILDI